MFKTNRSSFRYTADLRSEFFPPFRTTNTRSTSVSGTCTQDQTLLSFDPEFLSYFLYDSFLPPFLPHTHAHTVTVWKTTANENRRPEVVNCPPFWMDRNRCICSKWWVWTDRWMPVICPFSIFSPLSAHASKATIEKKPFQSAIMMPTKRRATCINIIKMPASVLLSTISVSSFNRSIIKSSFLYFSLWRQSVGRPGVDCRQTQHFACISFLCGNLVVIYLD